MARHLEQREPRVHRPRHRRASGAIRRLRERSGQVLVAAVADELGVMDVDGRHAGATDRSQRCDLLFRCSPRQRALEPSARFDGRRIGTL